MKAKRCVDSSGNLVGYRIDCPGCGDKHVFKVPGWSFNGNLERPTFTPSMLARCGHFVTDLHKPGDSCWCTYNRENPDQQAPFECYQCHSFVTDGKIQFLSDCSHKLAGQTVELPEIAE